MESRARSSAQQFSTLLEFMESHGDLSKPQPGAQGRMRAESLWQSLADVLNSVGGGVRKTPDKWKKVWSDWKSKTKRKALLIRRHARGTGGGPVCHLTLTALETRVLGIMGAMAVAGDPEIEEQGFYRPAPLPEVITHDVDGILPNAYSPPPPSPSPVPVAPTAVESTSRLAMGAPDTLVRHSASEALTTHMRSAPAPSTSRLSRPAHDSPPHTNTAYISSASPPSTSRQSRPARDSPPRMNTTHMPSTPPPSTSRQSLPPRSATAPSPHSSAASPSRRQIRARRRRGLTPFDRAASEFVAIEQQRLRLDEMRERNEARRIEVEHERQVNEARRLKVEEDRNRLLSFFTEKVITLIQQHLNKT